MTKQQEGGSILEPRRRRFFRRSGAMAGAVVTGTTLATLSAHMALAHDEGHGRGRRGRARASDYGNLAPVADQNGDMVLALPKGFEYVTFSKTGEAFGTGLAVPRNHDGMACFDGRGDVVRLIRNHELRNAAGDFTLAVNGPAPLRYDTKGMGGCMTLDFDTKRKRLVRQFISVGGTVVNCAGGYAWRDAGWITCEETTNGVNQGFDKPHGYNFLVPASAGSTVAAIPFKAMGRFSHEASVADEEGIVYQTEDAGNSSGFYRFTPNQRENLAAGGLLEMLAVTGNAGASMFIGQRVGVRLPVHWVPIPVPDPNLEGGGLSCFAQGRAAGGAAFNRLEGIWRGLDGGSMYFVSTSGGEAQRGQLWHYIPGRHGDADELVLVFQSPLGSVLDSPDNITVTPNGGLLFCEDDASGDSDGHPLAPGIAEVNRLIGIGLAGETFEFAVNRLNDSEFAGATFSPDGEILFVNLFGDAAPGSGMTCAIWGPWERGPL
jgi:hypothetical protein